MILPDKLHRTGGILSRRRGSLPMLFAAAMVIAFIFATPFRIDGGVFQIVISCLVTLCGLLLRYMSIRPDAKIEELAAENGIYSVVRFPNYLSGFLILCGLAIYAGIGWFLLIYIGMAILVLERIILFEDNVCVKRHGEIYEQWCGRTNAFFLPLRKFQPFIGVVKIAKVGAHESILLLIVVGSYALINLFKNFLIYFSVSIDMFWLILLAIFGFFALFFNLNRLVFRSK